MDPYLIDEAAGYQLDGGDTLGETRAGRELLRMARAHLQEQEEKGASISSVPVNAFIARREDMSRTGRLRLIKQEDGDLCVAVIDEDGHMSGVEFCVTGIGGGKSPRTVEALNQLALAIIADNLADPAGAAER